MSNFNDRVNLPNFLSVLRVLLLPFLLYYMSKENEGLMVALLVGLIIVSDMADGFAARRLNQVTDTGKILDPLADKICSGAVGAGLVLFRDFPLWVLLAIILRDVTILFCGLVLIKKRKTVVSSNKTGKVTIMLIAATFVFYLVPFDSIKIYLLYLTLVFMVLSLFSYYRNNYHAVNH